MKQQLEQEERENRIAEEKTQEREPSITHEEKPELHLSRTQEETDGCATEVTESFFALSAVFCVKWMELFCFKVDYATRRQARASQHVSLSDANDILSLKPTRYFILKAGRTSSTARMPSSFIKHQTRSLETQAFNSESP